MNELKSGIKHRIEYTVKPEDSASSYGSGLLEVFATPAMIALMEKCSMECVQEHLSEGYGTVGTLVNIKHLKATKIGKVVTAESYLTLVDGRRLEFEVNVYEDNESVGSGSHERFIINNKKFLEKIGM